MRSPCAVGCGPDDGGAGGRGLVHLVDDAVAQLRHDLHGVPLPLVQRQRAHLAMVHT